MTVQIFGDGNQVEIDPTLADSPRSTIILRGVGNKIRIGKCFNFANVHIEASNGATIEISENCNLGGLRIYALAFGASIRIGRGSSFNGASQITAHEASTITIGSGCLFAHGVSIASSDVHKIYDIASGERTNPAADVTIGDRVWTAENAAIMKGAIVANDSIIGRDAQVRGEFPPNVLIAGNPARVVRTGVRWEM